MIRLAVVGLGKMGLSHLSMIKAHPKVTLVGVCDSAKYVLDVLTKYTGVHTFTDYDDMLASVELDAIIIATPSHLHAPMVRKALERDIHVFCEKPLFLGPPAGEQLTAIRRARELGLQLYCGEFGCLPTVPRADRLAYYRDLVGIFEAEGIAYANWGYKGDFGVYEWLGLKDLTGKPDEELLQILAPKK